MGHIEKHIEGQEEAIYAAMREAVDGDDISWLEATFCKLKHILSSLDTNFGARPLEMLGSGYFPAFANLYDLRVLEMATAALLAIKSAVPPDCRGLIDELRGILGGMVIMMGWHQKKAKIFGLAICRMHPATLHLAEEAAA